MRQERLEELPDPLLQRLKEQRPRLPPLASVQQLEQLDEPMWHVHQLLSEPPEELRREVRLTRLRSPLSRVREQLVPDSVLPPPPPRQRSLQQPEPPLKEPVDPRLQEHA